MNITASIATIAPRDPVARVAAPEWIETPSAGSILKALAYAQAMPDIAIVYGAEGIGKTHAARRYAAATSHVWIATMTRATAALVPALAEVCGALGMDAPNGARALHLSIVQRMFGSGGLLIVDNAHVLEPAALCQLCTIYEASGAGLALVGGRALFARVTGGDAASELEQLRAHVGRWLALPTPHEGDIAAVADAWGVAANAARTTLAAVAAKPGGLRNVTKLLRLAAMQSAAGSFTDASLRAVWREFGGA